MARIVSITHSFQDYPDPNEETILVTLSGCSFNCEGCQNKSLQDPNVGDLIDTHLFLLSLKEYSKKYNTKNITFIGGDPLFPSNIDFIKYILYYNNDKEFLMGFNFCIYTGYDLKFIKKNFNKGDVKYWKIGLFDKTKYQIPKKTDKQFVLASTNQEWYDTNFKKISKKGILKFKK